MKVQITTKAGKSFITDWPATTQLTKNFTLVEVANMKGDTSKPLFIWDSEIDLFMQMLQELRDWYRKPIQCNSMYRQPAYNKQIGGAHNSLHMKALAFDWGVSHSIAQRVNVRNQWEKICQKYNQVGGIIWYEWGYHLDIHEDYNGYKSFQCWNKL